MDAIPNISANPLQAYLKQLQQPAAPSAQRSEIRETAQGGQAEAVSGREEPGESFLGRTLDVLA